MERVELKIAKSDWIYIVAVGVMFGLLLAFLNYFINTQMRDTSAILFSAVTGLLIALFASVFVTISNNFILPRVNRRFWYVISFFFSFISGSFGFIFSYVIFALAQAPIILVLKPYLFGIASIAGLMTFLVGVILHHFIAMKYRHESYKSAMMELRLKSLENELNPHFIFNALNSIMELIHQDPNIAEEALMRLSKLLRSAIIQKSLIPLSEELEMVENYLALENIRHENRIVFDSSVEEKLLEKKVPKFSIQLIIENAIKHGYENKPLHIGLSANPRSILVCNNGKRPAGIVYGTGLSNLDRRLRLLEVGELSFENTENVCFKINWKESA